MDALANGKSVIAKEYGNGFNVRIFPLTFYITDEMFMFEDVDGNAPVALVWNNGEWSKS